MLQPFQWGQGGQKLTPGQVKIMRELAAAKANRQTPTNLGEGLASVGDALLYNTNMSRAAEAESAGIEQVKQALAEARASGSSDAFLDVMGNEWATPGQQLIAGELYKRSIPDWQTMESGGDVYRWNANDQNASPELWFDGQDAAETGFSLLSPEEVSASGLPAGSYQRGPDNKLYEIGGSGQTINVNTGEGADGALSKALSTKEGESWNTIKDAGTVAGSLGQDLGILDELIKVAPQGVIVGPLAETFKGFSSAGDAFQSVVKRVAPSLRTPGSGATSDIEYQGFLDSLPSLKNSPEANLLINEIMKSKAALNVERSNVVTRYQSGELTAAEARAEMARLNSISIITPEMRKAMLGVGAKDEQAGAPPPVGHVEEGYQYIGGNPASPTSWRKVN
jgi:hypothetical protein